ncbi:MAG: lipocalin family protein, partial [Candidatus Eisenbacteria bacterium]
VDYARGTVREADGTVSSLLPEDWDLRALDRWTVYPSGWQLSVTRLGIAVEIRPLLESQENVSELVPGLRYWEGAVEVRDRTGSVPGAIAGTGYVELTGYGPAGRLPF